MFYFLTEIIENQFDVYILNLNNFSSIIVFKDLMYWDVRTMILILNFKILNYDAVYLNYD